MGTRVIIGWGLLFSIVTAGLAAFLVQADWSAVGAWLAGLGPMSWWGLGCLGVVLFCVVCGFCAPDTDAIAVCVFIGIVLAICGVGLLIGDYCRQANLEDQHKLADKIGVATVKHTVHPVGNHEGVNLYVTVVADDGQIYDVPVHYEDDDGSNGAGLLPGDRVRFRPSNFVQAMKMLLMHRPTGK